jgi:glycosyltransferase involved in cell wall biosynthesis
MRIAAVIPAYNEASTIFEVASRTCRQVDWVIVVDDGSNDGTADKLIGLPVTVLRHSKNLGKAAALWRGMTYAMEQGAEAVLTLDADGQHRAEEIPRLVATGRRHPDKIIIAARLGGRCAVPGIRRFAHGMANFWISWAAGHRILDTQSGFRLYPAGLLKQMDKHSGLRNGFVFESQILIEAAKRGYYTESIAVDAIYPKGTRASYYRPTQDTLLIIRMVAWQLISRGFYLQGLLRSLKLWPLENWNTYSTKTRHSQHFRKGTPE